MSEPSEQRSIHSILVGFDLIRALERSAEPMPLKALAAVTGMSSGKAHAYLTSFRSVGLVQQDADSGRYALGPYALTLGLAALGRLDVRDAASAPMRRFRDVTGCAVHLCVWSGHSPVIVSRLDGVTAAPVSIRIGFALPLDISATGRIFLAFLPEAARHLAESGSAMDRALLERIVEDTRRRGLARTDGLLNVGFVGLSAPVFDYERQLAGALTALGPAQDFDSSFDGATAAALADAAATASRILGHRSAAAAY